jgi:hypothetical protein
VAPPAQKLVMHKQKGLADYTKPAVTIECSLRKLIRRPELLIGRHGGIFRQTEGHSFGDHLISESVSVMQSSVIEASIYCALFCVFMTRESQCPISLLSEHPVLLLVRTEVLCLLSNTALRILNLGSRYS